MFIAAKNSENLLNIIMRLWAQDGLGDLLPDGVVGAAYNPLSFAGFNISTKLACFHIAQKSSDRFPASAICAMSSRLAHRVACYWGGEMRCRPAGRLSIDRVRPSGHMMRILSIDVASPSPT